MIDEQLLIKELNFRVRTPRSTMEIIRDIIPLVEMQPTVSEQEIRNKAIEELKDKICSHFADWQYSEDDKWTKDIIELASESVEEIAEQMKERSR